MRDPSLVDYGTMVVLNDKDINADFDKTGRGLVTVEENTVTGGFGSAVCEIAAEEGSGCRIRRIGLRDCFATVVGDQNYLRSVYGMDAESIAAEAAALCCVNEARE